MDRKIVKRIVAREGLILLGIITLGIIIFFYGSFLNRRNLFYGVMPEIVPDSFYGKIHTLGIGIMIFGYPIYLLIRFIPWAIKTLKEK